jgi:hypothetical protein
MEAAALPRVGYATAEDYGDYDSPFTCLHPRGKQAPAARLALSALEIAYGRTGGPAWRQPTILAARGSVNAKTGAWTVTVSFSRRSLGGGGIAILPAAAAAQCPRGITSGGCVGPFVVDAAGVSRAARPSLTADGKGLLFKSRSLAAGASISHSRPTQVGYAYNVDSDITWPLHTVFSTHQAVSRFDRLHIPIRGFRADVVYGDRNSSINAMASGVQRLNATKRHTPA